MLWELYLRNVLVPLIFLLLSLLLVQHLFRGLLIQAYLLAQLLGHFPEQFFLWAGMSNLRLCQWVLFLQLSISTVGLEEE